MESAFVVIPNPVAEDAADDTKVLLAAGSSWRIGRHGDNDIAVPSHRVSRQHALIQLSSFLPSGQPSPEPGYYLIDLGSRNGSFVNGKRVSVPMQLQDGDLITVGDRGITFRRPTPDAAAQEDTLQTGEFKLTGQAEAYFSEGRVTALVIDVRNFTGLTQNLEQPVLCQLIGTIFREGGVILKARQSRSQTYIGDAILSVWIHQKDNSAEDMTEILRALLDLEEMTSKLQERFSLSEPIRIGAGVNTGLASVGNTGSAEHPDYTALGDSVNTAFRFENAAKEAGVDVFFGPATFATLQQLGEPQPYFSSHTVRLKGYPAPSTLWGASFEDLRRFDAKFLGPDPMTKQ
jgi:adenylate cyclase